MEGIQLKVENNNNISIIKVGGYIDTTTSSELEHHLTKLLERGSYNIVIDLGNVDYVSSAGWGIFISEIKGIREKGGDLKLIGMIPEVYEVFELLEFHYILKATGRTTARRCSQPPITTGNDSRTTTSHCSCAGKINRGQSTANY